MSARLIWDNLVTYSLQIGVLVAFAAFVPALLRLRLPRVRLLYWQVLLAACLVLPAIRPWRHAVVTDSVEVVTSVLVVAPVQASSPKKLPVTGIALAVLAGGVLLRLGWLAVGLWRLRRYRRRSLAWYPEGSGACATLLSDEVTSPVTFGVRRPVILLPAGFPELAAASQDAILCHERLHIERGDWLFTLAEELVRAVFWFHPAIWWLLGEIQLAREQAVDRAVVERTRARDEYVDALLAIAGAGLQPDLAPAPLFLRRRHLKQRVVGILKEVRMSKTKWISGLAAAFCILGAACWLVTSTFPLAAAPQVVKDAAGVTVDVGAAALMHRTPVAYPEAARKAGVQGVVSVEAKLDAAGNVVDARVLSGPDELRKAAITSVLQWHFGNGSPGATRVVNIGFQLPASGAPETVTAPNTSAMAEGRDIGLHIAAIPQEAPPVRQPASGTVKAISVVGLSDEMKSDLLARLPIHQGDTLAPEMIEKTLAAVKAFDEHLTVSVAPLMGSNDVIVSIAVPGAGPTIKVGGNAMQAKLVQKPRPMYPPEAKAARIQGVVHLLATIGPDGTVQNLEVLSGHPLLVASALEAVRQWVYQPTLLNGNPVTVQTTIDVNYTLSQ